jgi:hypothetical protein
MCVGTKLGVFKDRCSLKVFECPALGKTFGLKRDDMVRGWRKLHNEELHDFYSSPSIIRVIGSRRMKWAYGSNSVALGPRANFTD